METLTHPPTSTREIKIRVVTYNLRCDGEEGFARRLPLALRRIEDEKPDIIGFQEALPHMQRMLEAALTPAGYNIAGYGRDADYGGESNCVAYRRDTFRLFGFEQRALSPAPFIPGTRFEEQSPCPRVCVCVTLKHNSLSKPFRFYNTHLDHVGEGARRLGMEQILTQIKTDNDRFRLGIILTGDMNAAPNSAPISAALGFTSYPLTDTTDLVKNTFHDFGKLNIDCKIDYIFTDSTRCFSNVHIWDDFSEGIYISDHYPVSADLFFSAE